MTVINRGSGITREAGVLFFVMLILCLLGFYGPAVNAQVDTANWSDPLSHHPDRGRVLRQFLPDTGPDSMAVALPSSRGEQKHAYVFDADKCRLRYAWTGGFIHLNFHKRDGPAKIQGDIFHRAEQGFPLRFGSRELKTDRADREFTGFQLEDGIPVFQYRVDGKTIRHRITQHNTGIGLTHHFEIEDVDRTVWFVPDEKKTISYRSENGTRTDGAFTFDGAKAESISVSLTFREQQDR